jgi:hypothetical protein
MRKTIVLAIACVAACGGGAQAPTFDAPPPDAFPDAPPPDMITVAITTPADTAVIGGSRMITVAGTLAAAAPISSVTIVVGGVAFVPTFDNASFTGTVTLGDHENDISVVATDAIGGTGMAHVSVTYPFVRLTDFAPSSIVIGQLTAMTGSARSTDETTLGLPVGNAAVTSAAFYIPALGENRVVAQASVPTANASFASFVLGQSLESGATPATGATGMSQPASVATDGTVLVESDHANNRVLLWNTAPTSMDAPADVAIGQADTNANTGACDGVTLRGPIGLVIASGRLIVADTNNNRVMIWNALPTKSGVTADLVIGQADFTHCTGNDDNQDGTKDATPTARTVSGPIGVWSDGTHLWVADSSNNRVLVWNTFPTTSFAPADLILGQTSPTASAPGLGPTSLSSPQMLTSNGTQLALDDTNNNRVLIWNTLPAANTAPDVVLGQGDLTHGTANDDNQDGTADATPTARTLSAPRGVMFTATSLVVTDASNNRALIFP